VRRLRSTAICSLCFCLLALGWILVGFPGPSFAVQLSENTELSGFLRNNTGIFTGNQDFTENNDKLATCRNWVRLKLDTTLDPAFSFRLVTQGIYEPKYRIEEGSTANWNEYDELDVREVFFTWKPTSSNIIRVGRQIVTWGESLAFRVGDVINPQDARFAFSFANLEDTRIPQWMARGVHHLTGIRSSFEWIVNPPITQDKYRVDTIFAEPTSAYATTTGWKPGWRFAIYPETRLEYPYSVTPSGYADGVIVGPSLARSFAYYNPLPFIPGFPAGYYPVDIPSLTYKYPENNDVRYGFRTSTTMSGYNFGVFFWHTQEYTPLLERSTTTHGTTDLGLAILGVPGLWVVPNREYYAIFPDVNILGAYVNKEMPLGVLRGEFTYRPRRSYNTLDPSDEDALVKRDNIQYLIAWDIQTMCRPLTETGTVDINLEYHGSWVLGDTDYLNVAGYLTPIRREDHEFLLNLGTSFDYNRYSVGITVIYNTQDHGAVMPSVKFVPDFMNKAFSFELKYINIFGDSDYEGLGLFRQKDMVVLTSQWSF